MIKFKDLLLEDVSQRSKGISLPKALDVYKNRCKSHSPVNRKIWRGTDASFDSGIGVVHPSKHKRSSIGEKGNHYTLLIDNLENWSEFPKRSRSIICSMSKGVASGYGTLYVVIPFDGAEIAVAPNDDLWYSFKPGLQKYFNLNEWDAVLSHINTSIDVMLHVLEEGEVEGYLSAEGADDKSFSGLKKDIKKIDKNISRIYNTMNSVEEDPTFFADERHFKISYKVAKALYESNQSFYDLLKKALDPSVNGFNLKTYKEGFKTMSKTSEVWTDSSSLLVEVGVYDEFIKKVT